MLRAIRHAGLVALSPLDYAFRALNGKRDLPPLHLRRYVGPLQSFESSGADFMGYLLSIAELQTYERVLDIGCGCGQMALQLEDYVAETGRYVGVDIHRPSIDWCQKKISSRRRNFQFLHVDVRNLSYNPAGIHPAETYRLPFADGSFDVVLLKSVFTHMRPAEVSNYLGEAARLLNADGRCLATFFLLNDEQAALARQGASTLTFGYGEGVWRYRYEHSPESAVAYEEGFIAQLIEQHGLVLRESFYGSWAGRKDALSYQDILLISVLKTGGTDD